MEKFLCLCAWEHKPCLGLQSPAGLGWEQEVLGGCWPCPVPHCWWRLMWQESGRVIRNLSTLKSWLLLGSFLGLTGCGGVELWVLSPHPAQAAAGGLLSPHEINATIYTRETQRFEVWFFNFFLNIFWRISPLVPPLAAVSHLAGCFFLSAAAEALLWGVQGCDGLWWPGHGQKLL